MPIFPLNGGIPGRHRSMTGRDSLKSKYLNLGGSEEGQRKQKGEQEGGRGREREREREREKERERERDKERERERGAKREKERMERKKEVQHAIAACMRTVSAVGNRLQAGLQ
jgi:hypothetical protein